MVMVIEMKKVQDDKPKQLYKRMYKNNTKTQRRYVEEKGKEQK